MLPTYAINPTPPRGYELTGLQFGVVMPVATTNLIPNPSAENDLTGYVVFGTGAALVQSAGWAWAGVYSVKATGLGVNSGPSYFLTSGAIVAGAIYSGSVRFKSEAGKTYQARLATNSATLSPPVRGTGREMEIAVTHQADGSGFASLAVIQNQTGGQNTIYADAWQIEALPYATTYVDGDRRGFVRGAVEYAWTGQPHASTSTRSGQCRAGGRVIMLRSLGFRLISMIGLGVLPLSLVATPLASGGGYYQTTYPQTRDFSLVGDLYAGDLRPLQAQRAELAAVLNPFATVVRQPLLLTYQATDDCDRPISAPCEIVAHYAGGMTGVTDSQHHERLALEFRMFLPVILRRPDSAAILEPVQTLTTEGLVQRTSAGEWQGLTTGTNLDVLALAAAPDGGIYVGGSFTLAGGVAGTSRIARWDAGAWTPLGTGAAGGAVQAMAVLANGDLVIAGGFTSVGGVASTAQIARWDGTNWHSMGSGATGTVYALAVAANGDLYATGDFPTIDGGGVGQIARWDGTNWLALGAGLNGSGYALLRGSDGGIYVGGDFTTANGTSTPGGIARWDASAATFSALAGGVTLPGDLGVTALAETPNGILYAGGDLSAWNNIAQWNGTAWAGVGGGQPGIVSAMAADTRGLLYVAGGGAGGLVSPLYTTWNGTSWIASEISSAGPNTFAILPQPDGTLTFGGDYTSPIVTAGNTTITNAGTADAAPTFRLTGPAPGSPAAFVFLIANRTTGATIAFDGLYISPGEVITISLDPTNISMTSSLQGNVIGYVAPGSNVTGMALQPGANILGVYLSDAGTTATVTWRDSYLGVDDAVIR